LQKGGGAVQKEAPDMTMTAPPEATARIRQTLGGAGVTAARAAVAR
jgi:hypothetical protein